MVNFPAEANAARHSDMGTEGDVDRVAVVRDARPDVRLVFQEGEISLPKAPLRGGKVQIQVHE